VLDPITATLSVELFGGVFFVVKTVEFALQKLGRRLQ
jgi:hypothetical protein